MRTNVFANGLEIAARAVGGDGVSPSAFPDPCWSPPPPSAGPVVIPYPNTCYATHITNGTCTVFIAGKEVAIEDESYFSTSTGNEPATQAFNKGVKTGVIIGRAYFTQWSFDVIFEGFGVPRHTDLVSHNHGSQPGNTPLFPYLSKDSGKKDCKGEKARIERACEPEKEHSEERKSIKKQSRALSLLKKKGGKPAKKADDKAGKKDKWNWTDDHCDGLNTAVIESYEQAREYAKQMKEVYEQLPEVFDVMGRLEAELKDMAVNAGLKAVRNLGGKAVLKQGAGTVVPAVGNVLMALWSVADVAMTVGDVNEIRKVAAESLEQLDVLKEKVGDLKSLSERFKNMTDIDNEDDLLSTVAEGQDLLATINNCLRARKCNLVSHNQAGSKGTGCCPGQSGHHLIYDKMMQGAGCTGYTKGSAPTVCAEGANQHRGSHGRVHDKMDEQVSKLAKDKKLENGTMSMDQAIEAAVKSHSEAFPLSGCTPECIRAQLKAYYVEKKGCANTRPKAVDKKGNPHEPEIGTNTDD